MTLPASGPLSLNDIQGEFGGTNPIGMNEYYAGGGLVPAGTTGTFGAVPSSGALSVQNFYGTSQFIPIYIEEVFSTWLYNGNSSTQTITNGIDLAGEGGLVWLKYRSGGGNPAGHYLYTPALPGSGGGYYYKHLQTNNTNAAGQGYNDLTAFNSNGFSLGGNTEINYSGDLYASWTFRKQPKFFDVVTYTGNGANRTIAHNLGSVPGCIIIKRTDTTDNWVVYHRSLGNDYQLFLNLTLAQNYTNEFNFTTPTSTVFSVNGNDAVNASGGTYVAYLFAHNAGGFGLTGTDNVISCGSFTTDASKVATVNLGYEPQYLLVKTTSQGDVWRQFDTMRGWAVSTSSQLFPNLSDAEASAGTGCNPTATGFVTGGDAFIGSATYIYIAIRRGPMKVPTLGTSVFSPTAWTGSSTTRVNTTGFVTDLNISRMRQNFSSGSNLGAYWVNRLTGASPYLRSDSTNAEASQTNGLTSFASNTAVTFGTDTTVQAWNFDNNYRNYSFRRAPGFFDEVCYTGTGVSSQTFNHNLGVVPELMIVKCRSQAAGGGWIVYSQALGNNSALVLNSTDDSFTPTAYWNTTSPTASVFSVNADTDVGNTGRTYVNYLFATCPGVSKVGSYTGNGSSQTINCGFAAGARFVMIKAASTTGNWVFTDVNGINAGNDRALYMNNADVEGFAYDWIDIDSTGFIVNETAVISANTNGVTYIYLAIA